MSDTASAPTRPTPAADGSVTVKDEKGRTLVVRSLSLLEEMDLIEAAGTPTPPDRWMMIATFAACVQDIDGVPQPGCTSRKMIRAAVQKVGPEGLRAAVKALAPEDVPEGAEDAIVTDPLDTAKN